MVLLGPEQPVVFLFIFSFDMHLFLSELVFTNWNNLLSVKVSILLFFAICVSGDELADFSEVMLGLTTLVNLLDATEAAVRIVLPGAADLRELRRVVISTELGVPHQ